MDSTTATLGMRYLSLLGWQMGWPSYRSWLPADHVAVCYTTGKSRPTPRTPQRSDYFKAVRRLPSSTELTGLKPAGLDPPRNFRYADSYWARSSRDKDGLVHSNASHKLAAETSTPRCFAPATPPFLMNTPASSRDAKPGNVTSSSSVLGGAAEATSGCLVSSWWSSEASASFSWRSSAYGEQNEYISAFGWHHSRSSLFATRSHRFFASKNSKSPQFTSSRLPPAVWSWNQCIRVDGMHLVIAHSYRRQAV